MSRKVQKTHQFNLRKSNTRVLMANNQEAKVFGETNRLRVDIKGHMSRINFTVIEGCEYDILLGMDYFNKTRVGIFPSERLLKFPNGYVFLDEHKNGRIDWDLEEDLGLNELFNVHTVV